MRKLNSVEVRLHYHENGRFMVSSAEHEFPHSEDEPSQALIHTQADPNGGANHGGAN